MCMQYTPNILVCSSKILNIYVKFLNFSSLKTNAIVTFLTIQNNIARIENKGIKEIYTIRKCKENAVIIFRHKFNIYFKFSIAFSWVLTFNLIIFSYLIAYKKYLKYFKTII